MATENTAAGRPRRTLLVRPPSTRLADGELTHLERVPVDADLAAEQWQRYVEVFRGYDWDVRVVPGAERGVVATLRFAQTRSSQP